MHINSKSIVFTRMANLFVLVGLSVDLSAKIFRTSELFMYALIFFLLNYSVHCIERRIKSIIAVMEYFPLDILSWLTYGVSNLFCSCIRAFEICQGIDILNDHKDYLHGCSNCIFVMIYDSFCDFNPICLELSILQTDLVVSGDDVLFKPTLMKVVAACDRNVARIRLLT